MANVRVVNVDGLATVKVQNALWTPPSGSLGALAELGVTIDGVHITEFTNEIPVYTDEDGGPESGVPSDLQDFPDIHVVRMVLSKYDPNVLDTLRAGVTATSETDSTAIAGTLGRRRIPGYLKRQGSAYFRLLIHTPNNPRNYLAAVIREPREINKGTKHSQAIVVATCFDWVTVSGNRVLYNTTTS